LKAVSSIEVQSIVRRKVIKGRVPDAEHPRYTPHHATPVSRVEKEGERGKNFWQGSPT
jgi:hypothetical protein